MNLDSILWGVSGYFAFLIFQLVRPARNRSGWDFVIQVASFSVCVFALTRISRALVLAFVPPWLNTAIHSYWYITLGFPANTLPLAFGCVVAGPLVGCALAFFWRKVLSRAIASVAETLGGKRKDLEHPDVFFATCHQLLSEMVFISLKGGKVYVGILVAATEDPNESQRFLRVTPVMSGFRDKTNLKVTFTTVYTVQSGVEDKVIHPKDFLFPVSEISSMTQFDQRLHDHFLSEEATAVG